MVVGQGPSPACSQAAHPCGDQETRDKIAAGCEDGSLQDSLAHAPQVSGGTQVCGDPLTLSLSGLLGVVPQEERVVGLPQAGVGLCCCFLSWFGAYLTCLSLSLAGSTDPFPESGKG